MIICQDLRSGTGCGAENANAARHCQSCGRNLRYALVLRDPGTIIGHYRIDQVIGHGGFGVVYEAQDLQPNGLAVALKETFDADNIRSFAGEFRVLQRLNHPNLPCYYEMFEADGSGFLAMEYVPGQSLDDVLMRRPGPLLESQVMGYALQVCDALTYLHSQQPPIIHRDIKPANIRLTPEGLVKLVDFGLLKEGAQETQSSRRGFTPAYAPIEQWGIGNQRTDPRSDIYSLGATLFHLLTGEAPPPVTDRIAGSQDSLPPLLQLNPAISKPVALAVFTAMEIQASKRHADVASFKRALQGVTSAPVDVQRAEFLAPFHERRQPHNSPQLDAYVALPPQGALPGGGRAAIGSTIALPQAQQQHSPALASLPSMPCTLTIPGLNAIGAILAIAAIVSGGFLPITLEAVLVAWIVSVLATWYIFRQRGGNPWPLTMLAAFASIIAPVVPICTLFLWPKHRQSAPRPVYNRLLHRLLGILSIAAFPIAGMNPPLVFFAWYWWILVAEYMSVSKGRPRVLMALIAALSGPIGVVIAWLIPEKRPKP